MEDGVDINAVAAGLLHDLSLLQTVKPKQRAFQRAAEAVQWLEEPLTRLWTPQGPARPIAGVGPSSSRVINEVLATGGSPTVEKAIEASGLRVKIDHSRALRSRFFSRAAALEILRAPAAGAVAASDCLGDFQMHTDWSDGATTIAEMAAACQARGYQYAAMTDHAQGLRIARGMSMEIARKQHREIDALNRRARSFRILKGIEANIGPDGQIDLSAADARAFDLVLAAPHTALRLATDQTTRMLTALEQPGVRVLAHPRGRQIGTRAGIIANWDRVFARAAKLGVAIELDGDPSRQDLDYEMAARALDAGCLFAVDSDAHSPDQLAYTEIGLAHARLAGIPAKGVVNCWPLPRLREWLGR